MKSFVMRIHVLLISSLICLAVVANNGVLSVGEWAEATISSDNLLTYTITEGRPENIGLSNTLVAPSTFIAPILAGFLIDNINYEVAFLASAIAGFATLLVLIIGVKDPRRRLTSRSLVSPTD